MIGVTIGEKLEPIAKPAYSVTPAKAGVQNALKRLDSGFRRNDVEGLLQLAHWIENSRWHIHQYEWYSLISSYIMRCGVVFEVWCIMPVTLLIKYSK